MPKHYGKFLPDIGRLKEYSDDLEILYLRKEKLEKDLEILNKRIETEEAEFLEFAKIDWTTEEIQEAKERAKQQLK